MVSSHAIQVPRKVATEGSLLDPEDGFRIVSLTNFSSKGVEVQFKNVDVARYFEEQDSVDSIRNYKLIYCTFRQRTLSQCGQLF